MSVSVCVCVLPVASLRQTLQDVVTEAELLISLTAIDALQGDRHQLVWVPDDLLLALEERGEERGGERRGEVRCVSIEA